jgi:DNA polymerase I
MKLLLVDGSALLHRAYHAYPMLTTKSGAIVGAVYGVTSMLYSALADVAPSHVVVAWDLPTPTFRHIQYVGYKAQRRKADPEMIEQIPIVKEMITAMGLVQLAQEGYEADDIIGSLSHAGDEIVDSEVVILTGDQDTTQLVTEHVRVLTPPKGQLPAKLYGVEEVREKYGVWPHQIVDYKALIGDPSDNIPGVAGIGPTTASKLLQEYGSLSAVYEAINSKPQTPNPKQILNPKLVQKLQMGRDSALLSQELSRIVLDLPLPTSFEQFVYSDVKNQALRSRLEELGFKSLVRRIWGEEEKPKKTKVADNQMGLF